MTDTTLYYVCLAWDNWPEGGTYATLVWATDDAAAQEQCKAAMAATRTEFDTPEQCRHAYEGEWEVIDCFPAVPFAAHIFAAANNSAADTRAALGQLLDQVYQMQGMFGDEDGAIARAVADAEAAYANVTPKE